MVDIKDLDQDSVDGELASPVLVEKTVSAVSATFGVSYGEHGSKYPGEPCVIVQIGTDVVCVWARDCLPDGDERTFSASLRRIALAAKKMVSTV